MTMHEIKRTAGISGDSDGRERSTMEGAGQRMKAAYTRYGPPDVVEVNGRQACSQGQ